MDRRRLVAVGILLACFRCAFALNPSFNVTQYAHRAWTVSDGFFKGEIHAITQTRDGYLWLATEFGLLRFDGVRAVLWQPPSGEHLPSNDIRGLAAAADGTLWIGTAKGLVSWKDGKIAHYPQFDRHDVNAVLEDSKGTVWAAGTIWEGGLSKGNTILCAINSTGVQCYGTDGSFGAAVTALYEDSRHNLWLGASNGVWRWRPKPANHYELSDLYGSGGFIFSRKAFVEDKAGAFVISGPRGIAQLLNGKLKEYPLPPGTPQITEGLLLRDRDGGLWIGTLDSGVIHVHEGRTDTFTEADGLSSNPVRNLFEDREGNIWVATVNGLDRFREYAIVSFSVKEGLSSPYVRSVLADRDGSVWLGAPHGLDRWSKEQLTIYRKPRPHAGQMGEPLRTRTPSVNKQWSAITHEIDDPGLPDDEIGSLYQDDQGRVWASTAGGPAYFDAGRFHPLTDVHLPHWFLAPVALDRRGNLWMTSDQGIYRLRGGAGFEFFPSAELGLRGLLSTLLVTDPVHEGLWLASWEGGVVYWKDKHVLASYWPRDGLGSGRVNALYLDRENTIWAATDGGLSGIRNGRVTTLTSGNGLPCDTVHGLTEDDEHSFWLYMACGLVRISRPEIDAWVARPKSRIHSRVFDIYDGVRSHSGVLNYAPRMAKAADGKVWFVTLNGVSVVDPQHLPINNVPPPVRIEQITADRKVYDAAAARNGRLRLSPRIHDLSIDYTALTFVAPEKVHFRFKLDGQDEHWREVVNNREVQYSNLPPRHYRFRVVACNNSGVWNETGDTLDFWVAPAYYQTNWFRALVSAAFLTLLWAAYQVRVRHLRREERRLCDVIETMPTFAWTALPDGSVDFMNRRCQEYTGLSIQKIAGSGWESAVHPSDLQRYAEKWHASVATGEPLEDEVRLRRAADGQYRWFLARAVALRDARGKILKWFGISTEIEDRKLAEQERETLRADLAHVNRVDMLGELAASLSHELKQPITAAMTNARTALRWLKREQPDVEEACEAANRIVNAGTRSVEIIDRLRSLYKKSPPQREVVDVNETVRDMVVLLRSEANRYAVSMRTDFAADLPKITADRVQLQQVLMNLMLNAIEAMKETGGVMTVKSQLGPNDQLLISVSDTGVGLPPEGDQIFNAFFTTKPQGSGMGLAISRSIIESHGGRLWATANDGRGATFHFSLPSMLEART